MNLSADLAENKEKIRKILPVKQSFDVIERELNIGGKKALLYFVDGFVKDEIMEKISRSGLSSLTEEEREVLRRASRR